jgi:molybdopterin-containing oxidoreductase family iron-sulfur binding subunit
MSDREPRPAASLSGHPSDDELAPGVTDPPAPATVTRRGFLQLVGASAAFAAACGRSRTDELLTYTTTPADVTPSVPDYYATSVLRDGHAVGLLVRSNDGRPTKVDGHPEHPASLGASSVFEQALVLSVYDPERKTTLTHNGEPRTWPALAETLSQPRSDDGAGLRLLLEPHSSPLVASLLQRLTNRYPQARVTFYAPGETGNGREGARLLFGRSLQVQNDFSKARVIVALDADIMASGPMSLRHAQQVAEGRRLQAPNGTMSRLFVAEAMPSPTGTLADVRLRVRTVDVAALAARLAAAVGVATGAPLPALPSGVESFVAAAAAELLAAGRAGVVVTGDRQPPAVHALAYAINQAVGSVGSTTWFTASTLIDAGAATQDLAALSGELQSGTIDTLFVLGGNPVATAPPSLRVGEALSRVATRIYLGPYENETAQASTWAIPALHPLETWADGRAWDGTVSFAQPLIDGPTAARAVSEILAALAGDALPVLARDLLQGFYGAQANLAAHVRWEGVTPGAASQPSSFSDVWQAALKRGFLDGTEAPPVTVSANPSTLPALAPAADGLELNLALDPKLHDGVFANNAWLLELPAPITKLTWGNAAVISPALAGALGVGDGDVVRLAIDGASVNAPVLTLPGHADRSVTLTLGWGRRAPGLLCDGVGVDGYPLRLGDAWAVTGLEVTPTGDHVELARTQTELTQDGRPIALHTDLSDFRLRPDQFAAESEPSLMAPAPDSGNQWAMAIDLNACNGCSACVVACQAENNTLVVGKDEVLRRREMYWLRIDTYFDGPSDEPVTMSQPMLCQHCEKAPCEYVCPVNATVHSTDGLNEMIYNRCVGTRFCSNNCPYKVRRFNWFNWIDREPANQGLVQLQRNPDVTVRARGVMEKCSFCVQRIREAEIQASAHGRELDDGEVQTACQQACPTRAITFGSIGTRSDGQQADSRVRALRDGPRAYGVLTDLGTRPRVKYLARIRNDRGGER